MDPKSDAGIFLGYSTNSRAYRVLNSRTRTVMESINVVVDDLTPVRKKDVEEDVKTSGDNVADTKDSTGGVDLPPDSFGHNGFTGTSVWIDPEHQRIFILLTNRTHAHTLPFANINALRREFHSIAVKSLK